MKVRLRKPKINESVAGITDPTLMQQSINIENQKIKAKEKLDLAKKEYNQRISDLDKQLLQIMEKQKTINDKTGNDESNKALEKNTNEIEKNKEESE